MAERKKVSLLASTEVTLRGLFVADLVRVAASVSGNKTRIENIPSALRALATKIEKRIAAEAGADASLKEKRR
jgi:hypothetical protein